MPTFIADFISQAKTIWSRLDGGQRVTIGTILLATIMGMCGLVWFAGRPDYVTLKIANGIVERNDVSQALLKAGIEAKLDGMTVLVRTEDKQMANGVLITEGLTGKSGAAGSIIANLTKSASSARKAEFHADIRITERKLEMTPMIREARIATGQEKKLYFRDQKTQRKATVVIKLIAGADFHTAASLALEMTASSLRLAHDKVKVYNAITGETYSHSEHGGGSVEGVGFLRLQDEWQARLYNKAQSLLLDVFGHDVKLTVNLVLNKQATYSTGVNIPDGGLTPNKSEKTTEKSKIGEKVSTSVGGGPGGAAPAGGSLGSTGGGTTDTSSSKTNTFIDPKLYGIKTVAQLAPLIDKITASIVINKTWFDAIADNSGTQEQIELMVQRAIGFDKDRGDEVKSSVFKFVDPPAAEEPAGTDYMALAKDFAPDAFQVLAVVLVLMFLRGMLKKAQAGKKVATAEIDNPLNEESEEDLAPEEVARRMRREIEKAINDDSAAISRMLDNWLTEKA